MRSWPTRYVIAILLMSLTAVARAATGPSRPGSPPPAVTVAPVVVADVAPSNSFIGRVIAIQSVQVVPRVTAFIEAEPEKQGSDVKAGTVLFQLQKTQYQAALQSAQAQLESAKAAAALADVSYQRSARLNHQGFEAQASLDQAKANLDQTAAAVQTAQADVAQAALNLSYCTIVSPIDGRIGTITLTKGNLVTPSTPALATINQLDPIRVVFSVANRIVVAVEQKTGSTQAEIAKTLVVHLKLPDGTEYDQTGRIAFLNNQVDPQTGTVSVYADFANPRKLLLPGAFVNVEVSRAQKQERALVPVQAVQTDQKGSYVLLVGPDNKVKQQPVTLGRQIAQNFIVTKGVSGGERVIIEGVQKVRPGEAVNPVEAPPVPTASDGGAVAPAGQSG